VSWSSWFCLWRQQQYLIYQTLSRLPYLSLLVFFDLSSVGPFCTSCSIYHTHINMFHHLRFLVTGWSPQLHIQRVFCLCFRPIFWVSYLLIKLGMICVGQSFFGLVLQSILFRQPQLIRLVFYLEVQSKKSHFHKYRRLYALQRHWQTSSIRFYQLPHTLFWSVSLKLYLWGVQLFLLPQRTNYFRLLGHREC